LSIAKYTRPKNLFLPGDLIPYSSSKWIQFGPFQFDTLRTKEALEIAQSGLSNLSRLFLLFKAVVSQQARYFSRVPLHGVEAIAAVGDVGGGDVLGPGDQIVAGFSE
jgi:hypothetical protein